MVAYDRDVKVSFETFYDIIFVALVTKTLLKHTPQKSVSKINWATYIFLKIFLKYAIFFTSCANLKQILYCGFQDKRKKAPLRFKKIAHRFF